MATSVRGHTAKIAVALVGVTLVTACRVEEEHEARPQALVFGELETDYEQECLHLGVSTVWPDGIEVRKDPLRLVNARGRTIAEPGDVVRFAGGSGTGNESLPPGSRHVGDEVAILNEYLGKGLPEGVE